MTLDLNIRMSAQHEKRLIAEVAAMPITEAKKAAIRKALACFDLVVEIGKTDRLKRNPAIQSIRELSVPRWAVLKAAEMLELKTDGAEWIITEGTPLWSTLHPPAKPDITYGPPADADPAKYTRLFGDFDKVNNRHYWISLTPRAMENLQAAFDMVMDVDDDYETDFRQWMFLPKDPSHRARCMDEWPALALHLAVSRFDLPSIRATFMLDEGAPLDEVAKLAKCKLKRDTDVRKLRLIRRQGEVPTIIFDPSIDVPEDHAPKKSKDVKKRKRNVRVPRGSGKITRKR